MVQLDIFEFPLSLILLAVMLLAASLLRKTPFAGKISSRFFTAVLIAVVAVLVSIEGSWSLQLYHSWAFVAVVVLLLFSLCFTAIEDFCNKTFSSLMSHLGLFLVLSGGFFGAPDRTDVQIKLYEGGQEDHMAYDSKGNVVPLPFNLSLADFNIYCYEDGISPKQYVSTVVVDGKTLNTSVNHPCRHKGYRIFQSGFGEDSGSYSVLKIVRDPWLPVMALGALMLAIAAVLSLKLVWNSPKALVAALILAIVFGFFSLAKIKFGTLAPALRSLWFIPHLIIYMIAYALMALSVISGIASLCSKTIPTNISSRLLFTASSLLLIGMLCGAVWADQAWGNYWTWDAKECWAAATWLLTLVGTHMPKKRMTLAVTVLAFLAMQMTWYGVNYLPSSNQSLHTYNQNK